MRNPKNDEEPKVELTEAPEQEPIVAAPVKTSPAKGVRFTRDCDLRVRIPGYGDLSFVKGGEVSDPVLVAELRRQRAPIEPLK